MTASRNNEIGQERREKRSFAVKTLTFEREVRGSKFRGGTNTKDILAGLEIIKECQRSKFK